MSGRNGKRPPLVAERRQTRAAQTQAAKPARRGRAPRAPKPRRGLFGRIFFGLFGWLFRLVWWIGIRTAIVAALVIGGFVAYYAIQMPPYTALLDGRARGSVT